MTAKIIDGKAIAAELSQKIAEAVKRVTAEHGLEPGLAVVLVGDNPASEIYVRSKTAKTAATNMRSMLYKLPATASEAELLEVVERLNQDPTVHGILVQLPLPPHDNAAALIDRIDPRKDVDGFSAINLGHLALRRFGLRPCTPKGVMTLLGHTDRPVRGQHAVVVGVSNHVGRPLALELLIAGCTTTCCHKFTQGLEHYVREGDIVVAAVGKPGIVKGEWIKPGAVVIDVGINRMEDGHLVGDVEFAPAAERASWITPVPGGVGPMTVATLMENTLEAAQAIDGN
jgi:methylenetetrahydrofolate dehydrogenase (NADP+)/methenyltetrahydrofolate cyclohydrolase